jgi:hypothetical protein
MSNSKELSERARMFEERADKATDPISRQPAGSPSGQTEPSGQPEPARQ